MKKKGLFLTLALVAAFSAGSMAIVTQSYQGEGVSVMADDTKTALTIKAVTHYPDDLAYRGRGIYVEFDAALALGDWDTKIDATKVSLTSEAGVSRTFELYKCGDGLAVRNWSACETGDILTFQAGFIIGDYEVKTDVSYKYSGSAWNIYTGEEEPETELKFAAAATGATYAYNANYIAELNWGCPAMMFKFDTAKTLSLYQSPETMDLIEYKNAYGEIIPITDCIHVNENNFLLRWTPYEEGGTAFGDPVYAMVGDTVTFKKGFALSGNEKLAADMVFVVTSTASGQLAPYTAECAPSDLSITTSSEYSQISAGVDVQMEYEVANGFGTPYFTTSDETVATVTKSGLVTGVKEGEVTITAHLGEETVDFPMTILEASPIVGMEIASPYTVWIAKDATPAIPAFKAHLVFENGQTGADFALTEDNCQFAVDTSTLGEKTGKLTIAYQGASYEVDVPVSVYEIGDVSIKEVSIVEWFSFAIFIQYPDSTANTANITSDIGQLDSIFDHITYTRADGTDILVNGGYMLSGGNLAIFPFGGETLTIDNYNEYYLAGDVIRLEKGLKIWMWTGEKENTGSDNNAIKAGTGMYICEGILQETVEYRYDGNVWGVYVEYTDVSAGSLDITVEAGKNVDSNVSRVPSNATTGTFTYVSSDETIATVSSRGVIKGLKEGTCTITATLDGGPAGAKTVVLNVTVTDKIVGLNIATESITVSVGQTPDLSLISATLKWASGKAGAAVDLTNATLVGFDSQTAGEQSVVVVVTVDGVEYSGTLTVIVEDGQQSAGDNNANDGDTQSGGCLGSVGIFAPLTLLGAGLAISKKKRK